VQKEGQILVDAASYYSLQEAVKTLQLQNELLKQQLAQFKKMLFGSKHERVELLNSSQLSLDMNFGEITPIEPITEDIAYTRTKNKEKAQPNRSPLPADLPREIIEIAPEEDTTGMKLIGHEITEQL
jgi:hypothetical protein